MRKYGRALGGLVAAAALVIAVVVTAWFRAPEGSAGPVSNPSVGNVVDVQAEPKGETGVQPRTQPGARLTLDGKDPSHEQPQAETESAGQDGASSAPSTAGNALVALEVIQLLKEAYVSQVDVGALLQAYSKKRSIPEMLAVLNDPYTRYMDAAQYRTMQDDMRGTFDGIGITVGIRDGQLTVVAPLKGTPGEKAGLRSMDRIKFIDGKPTRDMVLDYAVSLMKGKKGTEVVLGVERDEDGKARFFEVRIVRDTIRVPHVASEMLEDGIGYVQISSFFGDDTIEALDRGLSELAKHDMQGLVLDLRYNPGGWFTLAIQVASRFVAAGSPVVHVVGKDGHRVTYYSTEGPKISVPMVVLVNEASASASEIVAGALQDMKVATIIGAPTFGKGLVQTVYPLSDGSAVSITTSRYLTAGGHSIDKTGIVPDIKVSLPEEPRDAPEGSQQEDAGDVQLEKAIEVLETKMAERKAA